LGLLWVAELRNVRVVFTILVQLNLLASLAAGCGKDAEGPLLVVYTDMLIMIAFMLKIVRHISRGTMEAKLRVWQRGA